MHEGLRVAIVWGPPSGWHSLCMPQMHAEPPAASTVHADRRCDLVIDYDLLHHLLPKDLNFLSNPEPDPCPYRLFQTPLERPTTPPLHFSIPVHASPSMLSSAFIPIFPSLYMQHLVLLREHPHHPKLVCAINHLDGSCNGRGNGSCHGRAGQDSGWPRKMATYTMEDHLKNCCTYGHYMLIQ